MPCKKCSSKECWKAGKVRGLQRYKCKACGYSYTITPPRGRPMAQKLLALILYMQGLSINKIAKQFDLSVPAVWKWIKSFNKQFSEIPEPKHSAVLLMEYNEACQYLEKMPKNEGAGRILISIEGDWISGSKGIITTAH